MNFSTLIFRSLYFHRRSHLGVFFGTAVAAAVLTGALLVGDSVRESLKSIAAARLGSVTHALDSGSRFFADNLAGRLEEETGVPTAPLLQARAVAFRRDADGRVGAAAGVSLIGVDRRFRRFAPDRSASSLPLPLTESEVIVNSRVARELRLRRGDTLTLRIGIPGIMPLDAPLSSRAGALTRLGSFTVAAVADDEQLGRFNLRTEQVPPSNIFVDLGRLQGMLGIDGKANVILAGSGGDLSPEEPGIQAAFTALFRLADGGYSLRRHPRHGVALLETERIFIDPPVAAAALELEGAAGSSTWLVDSLSRSNGGPGDVTPYSFITAAAPSPFPGVSAVPAGMKDDRIILNSWTAAELGAAPGDPVTVSYSVPTAANTFTRRSRTFTVHSVVGMEAIAAEAKLAPEFPGMSGADSCRDWGIGMPLDEEKLADEANERYWRAYRQTPKAFITLAAGRSMWSSRWGYLTAIRYPDSRRGGNAPLALHDLIVTPEKLGFHFRPVGDSAAAAVSGSLDFGSLFLGMSSFLVASALALTGLLHSFSVSRRTAECGTLMALGFSSRQVTFLFLGEGIAVTIAGAVAGSLFGTLIMRSLILGLGGIWQEAVSGAAIRAHLDVGTMAAGAAATALASTVTILITLRSLGKMELRAMISPGPEGGAHLPPSKKSTRAVAALALTGAIAASLLLSFSSASSGGSPASLFFTAGALLLLSFLSGLYWLLTRPERPGRRVLSLHSLAFRNARRRRWRSLATAGTFACGCFILVSVFSMRPDPDHHSGRSSGTGGFELFGESVLPLLSGDLAAIIRGKGDKGTSADRVPFETVAVKVRDGDDASCFNLNRAQSPRLLGVTPSHFSSRGSFVPEKPSEAVWDLLQSELPPGVIPALAGDIDTAMWNLRVKTGVGEGDEFAYLNERGEELRVRVVGSLPVKKSVFQGSILISGESFAHHFPSEAGYRFFLFDVGEGDGMAVRSLLEDAFSDEGMDISPAAARLVEFYAVEHAYLKIFLLLGGLGLLLASFGMGIVVLRNIEERRSEIALLGAVGFRRRTLGKLLFAEHAGLFAAGIAIGTITALLAVFPALRAPGADLPAGDLVLLLAALLATGFFWVAAANGLAARSDSLADLRGE